MAIGVRTAPRPVTTQQALSAAVIDDASTRTDDDDTTGTTCRWTPDRKSAVAPIGVAAILVSFWFDGHTVTKGAIHAVVDTIHVVAGSVWVGGIVTMVLLWGVRRSHS